jgi:hypothetical protein
VDAQPGGYGGTGAGLDFPNILRVNGDWRQRLNEVGVSNVQFFEREGDIDPQLSPSQRTTGREQ